jgi:hypothetical protein
MAGDLVRCLICTSNNTLYIYINDYEEIFLLCGECSEIANELKLYTRKHVMYAIIALLTRT